LLIVRGLLDEPPSHPIWVAMSDNRKSLLPDSLAAEPKAGVERPTEPKRPVPPKQPDGEVNGPKGPEPTRFGDWEVGGRCSDF